MRKHVWAFAAAALVTGIVWAESARADDFRSVVRDEVRQYLSAQQSDGGDNVFKVYWKHGLRLDTQDQKVKLKIGGRVMFDAAYYGDSDYNNVVGDAGSLLDGVEFRRLRLYNAGQIGKHVKFKAQIDFGDNSRTSTGFTIKDAYVDIVNLRDCFGCGFPNLRAGHFKAPFSLEELTSSKYITFMERALPNVFAPGRLSGFMLHDMFLGDQLYFGAGWFVEGTGDGNDGAFENLDVADGDDPDEGWSVAARIAWTPWFDCDCACNRWQIGASVWYRNDIDRVRYRARPESHVTSHRVVDTGSIATDNALHLGFETAFVYGPWSVQGEFMMAMPDVAGDPTLTGWYAYLSYWITGECRPLKGSTFGRVAPCCDFLEDDCCCWGGWEVAFRVSDLDLNDETIAGGEVTNFTLGLNWHLNPNTRIMFNAILSDVDSRRGQIVDENLFIFQVRFQVDW